MHGTQLVGGSDRDKPDRPASLTERQIECVRLAGQGKTDWEIGEILMISAKTVNFHVEGAKRKLGTPTRTHAAILAVHLGLIDPPPGLLH